MKDKVTYLSLPSNLIGEKMNLSSVYNIARNVGRNASEQRRKGTYEYCKSILREMNLTGSEYAIAVTKIAQLLGL